MEEVSLKKISGIPIKIKNERLIFGRSLIHYPIEIRKYKKNEKFFCNSKLDKDQTLYYIYRNSCLKKDKALFERIGLRYDITVIPPKTIGKELCRTIGHIHKNLKQIGRPAEIYQVISGKALFLVQNNQSKKIYAIFRKAGQKIIIPPFCGHITANASKKEVLVVSNIFIDKKNASDYSFFKKTHGPAYYPVWRNNKIEFEKNNYQKDLFNLKKIYQYKKLPFGIDKKEPIYKEFIKKPEKYLFLLQPKKFFEKLTDSFLF
jgi:glucose-6-phosphate isomerase